MRTRTFWMERVVVALSCELGAGVLCWQAARSGCGRQAEPALRLHDAATETGKRRHRTEHQHQGQRDEVGHGARLSTYSVEDCPSRASKSANRSAFLSRYCRSLTAVPGRAYAHHAAVIGRQRIAIVIERVQLQQPNAHRDQHRCRGGQRRPAQPRKPVARGRQRFFAHPRLQARAEIRATAPAPAIRPAGPSSAATMPARPAQAGQLRRCSCVSGEAALRPAQHRFHEFLTKLFALHNHTLLPLAK